ncbi:MAG: S8/S53 family peptidase [Bacteroidales bacterium]
MKKPLLTAFVLAVTVTLSGQRVADQTYWFYFTDKQNNGYSISQPHEFLSQRSLERRAWQSIPVDQADLPVTKSYVDSLASLGLEIRHTSKWLNGVLVTTADTSLADTLHMLSFIDTIPWKPVDTKYFPVVKSPSRFEPPHTTPPMFRYGLSGKQIWQLELEYLHERGYTGSGVLLTVLDAGFSNFNNLPSFLGPVANGQIIASRNFVQKNQNVYNSHSHGTSVSSIIVANWPDTLMGGAPDVQIILAITENAFSETRVEEYSWIEAAEWADSLGTDIINTSLGYTTFDDSTTNYTYEDMDGKTAHISIANSMTASRGIISVTSAGNSGNTSWRYIGAPADASDILAIGAVDGWGQLASFSSKGPTYDHRIKPEVSAMGSQTAVQSADGTAKLGYGTSYASPMIAGATAVLWQAYPALTSNELMRWIIKAGDRYGSPDTEYGYGIPNYRKAYQAISTIDLATLHTGLKIYPNPVSDYFYVEIPEGTTGRLDLKMFDIRGGLIHADEIKMPGRIDIPSSLTPGMYIIEINDGMRFFRSRIIKN